MGASHLVKMKRTMTDELPTDDKDSHNESRQDMFSEVKLIPLGVLLLRLHYLIRDTCITSYLTEKIFAQFFREVFLILH